jgi:ribosomal protein L11 methyltransferase
MKKQPPLWRVSVATTLAAEDAVGEMLAAGFGVAAAAYFDLEKNLSLISVFLTPGKGKRFSVSAARKIAAAGLERVAAAGLPLGAGRIEIARVKAEDWAESWKRHFHPLKIGRELLVKPSWSKARPLKNQAVVTLDPGLSFGTGQHPTTAFCLGEIVRCRQAGTAKSFLDIGTGSGILAIAAAKLGWRPIFAFDFDPQAVYVARENTRTNHVETNVKLTRGDVLKLPPQASRQFDLVCANLISNVLIAARKQIVARVKPGGTLVLAGILATEFGLIEKEFARSKMKLVAKRVENEWCSGSFCFL